MRRTGFLFLIIPLIINEWVLGISIAADGKIDDPFLIGLVRLFDFLCALFGVVLVKKLKLNLSQLKKAYMTTAIITFNFLILFAVINISAYIYLSLKEMFSAWHLRDNQSRQQIAWPSDMGMDFMRKVYPGYSDQDIKTFTKHGAPDFIAHPVLEYLPKPITSPLLNVGLEGMRHTKHIDDKNQEIVLDNANWVLGGSTTFGVGVSDGQTIPSYLQDFDPDNHYINFGIPSRAHGGEIRRLVYLLMKGYRPKSVIFIDGVNEAENFGGNFFHPLDVPSNSTNAYSFWFNSNVLNSPTKILSTLMHNLPAMKIFKVHSEDFELDKDHIENIYDPDSYYQDKPWEHSQSRAHASLRINSPQNIADKVLWSFELGQQFLKKLSLGFGFDYFVFLQPNGVINEGNPFINDFKAYQKSKDYQTHFKTYELLREKIQSGELNRVYDISNIHERCPECYVDISHYNPKLAKMIAEKIWRTISKKSPLVENPAKNISGN